MATTRRERVERQEAARRIREQAYRDHQRRYEAWAVAEERLRALVPKALEVQERALEDPEQGPKLALAVLKAAERWGAPAGEQARGLGVPAWHRARGPARRRGGCVRQRGTRRYDDAALMPLL